MLYYRWRMSFIVLLEKQKKTPIPVQIKRAVPVISNLHQVTNDVILGANFFMIEKHLSLFVFDFWFF